MFSAKSATLVLAGLLAVATPFAFAATPGEIVLDPAPAQTPSQPASQAPAQIPAAPVQTQAAREIYGPEKPSPNRAIRAALSRAEREMAQAAPEVRVQFKSVDAFYASRGDAPLWVDGGRWTRQAHGVFDRLQAAADDGLDLRAWRVYSLDDGPENALALGEVALSQAVAAYAFQASGGRVDPSRLSNLVGARPPIVPAAQALAETAQSYDADAHLQSYNPQHSGYAMLKAFLAQTRAAVADGRVAASDAVGTIRAPGKRQPSVESDILVNMEFWRWLPRELGADRIVVNLPEFTARLYRNDSEAYATRVIIGKPDTPTPLFSNRMEYLIVNPSWYVPQSIIKNEMMGKLNALRDQGYDIEYSGGHISIRQPPGERNALGRIKFIFPNQYAVYMHDTPTRHLFGSVRRAFSHGCVRVDQPFKFAEEVLGPDHGWSEEKLKKMLGNSERRVSLPASLPIHMAYFTASVDTAGELKTFEDLYGYARETKALLGLGG